MRPAREFGRRIVPLLVLALAATAAEPLVCRGFPAATAVDAVSGHTGRLVLPDGGLDRDRRLWFALPASAPGTAAQALAHAIGCWWSTVDGGIRLGLAPRLSPGRQEVRAYTSPLLGRLAAERIARELMDPWLGGSGGLALNPGDGSWTATLDGEGHDRLAVLLTALGTARGQAPPLLPDPDDPGPAARLARAPAGGDLGAWAIDLARCAGLAVALDPTTDPAQSAPEGAVATLGEAMAALTARHLQARVLHGCLCIGAATPDDRRHPAQRCRIALVPVGHLCRDDAQLAAFATRLAERAGGDAWRQPGWGIVPIPWSHALLISGDAPAIHAALAAVEAADGSGLETWMR